MNFCIDLSKLDIVSKIATIVIAVFNAVFAVYIFSRKNAKDENEKERDRKMSMLKTLVLDHSLVKFYSFFNECESVLNNLKQPNLTDDEKRAINDMIADECIKLRRGFIDVMLAIDKNLYDHILQSADEFQDQISDVIFDPGINLSHTPKYLECIMDPMTNRKTMILQILFSYRG